MAGESILIVEDDELSRKLVRDLLSSAGFEPIEATSGEEGVALAMASPPALVVMDVGLPGIDGIEAVRRMRGDPRLEGIPVLAVSASVMPIDGERIPGARFDAFLAKPIDPLQFLDEVRRLARRERPEAGFPT